MITTKQAKVRFGNSTHCAVEVTAGKNPRTFCFSTQQYKRLFRNRPPKLVGCGKYACAFEGPEKDTVVKITTDVTDVRGLLKARGSKHVVQAYKFFRLPESTVQWKTRAPDEAGRPYAMIIERVTPLGPRYNNIWYCLHSAFYQAQRSPDGTYTDYCCAQGKKSIKTPRPAGCRKVVLGLVAAVRAMRAQGMNWTDMHPGNIGWTKQGKLKVLDIGNRASAGPIPLPPLMAGARYRKK